MRYTSTYTYSLYTLVIIGVVFSSSCNSLSLPTPIIEVMRDEAPAWSPDGRYIAYKRNILIVTKPAFIHLVYEPFR